MALPLKPCARSTCFWGWFCSVCVKRFLAGVPQLTAPAAWISTAVQALLEQLHLVASPSLLPLSGPSSMKEKKNGLWFQKTRVHITNSKWQA